MMQSVAKVLIGLLVLAGAATGASVLVHPGEKGYAFVQAHYARRGGPMTYVHSDIIMADAATHERMVEALSRYIIEQLRDGNPTTNSSLSNRYRLKKDADFNLTSNLEYARSNNHRVEKIMITP
jgi:hypothetical protein